MAHYTKTYSSTSQLLKLILLMKQLCEETAHFCMELCDRGRSAGFISQKSSIFQQGRMARAMGPTVSAQSTPIQKFKRNNKMKHELLERALEIATKAHKGQGDKSGAVYIFHPIRCASATWRKHRER